MKTPLAAPAPPGVPADTMVSEMGPCGGTAGVPAAGEAQSLKPPIFLVGFISWKTFMDQWFPDHQVIRLSTGPKTLASFVRKIPRILRDRRSQIYVWSYKSPRVVEIFCRLFAVPLVRVEDGFLRSVQLGAMHVPPLSLCFAERALYFDATVESDLEHLLQTYDFVADAGLMERARAGIAALIASRLSKYNSGQDTDIEALYGPKRTPRILVVGQVEGDMSMIKGMTRQMTNNDLVRAVVRENPDAQVIYKPHPEVLRGIRKKPVQSSPDEVRDICLVLGEDVALADAFETVDRVYTMTSLSGLEALIRGIPVTCFGMPFYAGWGATDDRETCSRRTRRLTVEQIFAAAYLLHPRYLDPTTGENLSFEEALALLARMKKG
ncbi:MULTISPECIES: capsular polysaccharide biosynthesis protein [Alphaproteobacteria]|uniref:Capsular polysaccharide biosynthesis protein n=2 Tax=Alphaproteobacteria TaxID=28211 RepID=A0A512HI97_9HYPH|nr:MULTISPECIES: capsular polysaccharide biosynthesis protein [Alphaproteobacteria]GEO85177.1 capsular polysaccharide biosynthesis protein [Ciceribacter naphthalenivorans]GLR24489.1 capsular polysaccharide biosynthesis protein [Ciceribacter naphthalenivorans]GLT07345.1 capsular polysaccharide biosynthesis protein [Sphingomonas psychrolutea]